MKRIYSLLFSLTLVSSYSVAKTGKIDAKYMANKKSSTDFKSAKKQSSKLVNYKVNSGDTLYSIALKHHTTVAKITMVNGLEKEGSLKVGKSLKIPSGAKTTKNASRDITLASVVSQIDKEKKKDQVSKTEKKKKTASKLDHKSSSKKLATYKVKKGDSLYSIAKKSNITVEKLKKLNKIASNDDLKYGKSLTVSSSVPKAEKSKQKIAKVESKTKVAKAKTKKTQQIVFSDSSSQRKIVIDAKTGKSTFLSLISSKKSSGLKLSSAKKQLGKRYVWGATGPYTFDCSGFTSYVCKKNGVALPRTSINQSKVGKRVKRSNLKVGDLVFFDTSRKRKGYINHVGIYMGNNKFIHASSAKKKVVISSLEKPFYKARFKWGSRVKG